MSDENAKPDYTHVEAYLDGIATPAQKATVANIPWDQPATMIDLEGRTPIIGTIRDCALHFGLYKPHAKENARVLLTVPVHREGRKTRTWLLDPAEIAALSQRLDEER